MTKTNCPECGAVVADYFDHIDVACTPMSLFHMLEHGDIGEVEFTELALGFGLSLEEIGQALADAREEVE